MNKRQQFDDEYLEAVVVGLQNAQQKTIPCKYLYDVQGSELFDIICEQPEYYLNRTERKIIGDNCQAVADLIGPRATLIDLGAGTASKTGLILSRLERPHAYVPVDISHDFLMASAATMAKEFPELRVSPLCADFSKAFALPVDDHSPPGGTNVALFLGSTIGNISETEAVSFLTKCRQMLGPGGLMIVGVDLVKDERLLHDAYNDNAGWSAKFSLNMLHRINRELGGSFDVANFAHEGRWNKLKSRMEMHVVSLVDQSAKVGRFQFQFRAGESIHVGNCCKFTVTSFRKMASAAGYVPEMCWTDEQMWYSEHALRVPRN